MSNQKIVSTVLEKRFTKPLRIPAVLPPSLPPQPKLGWRESDPVLSAFVDSINRSTRNRRGFGPFWALAAQALVIVGCMIAVFSSRAGVREVGAIGLTVNDLGSELNFFTNTLPFELVSISDASGGDQDSLLGLRDVKLRLATLKLGNESVVLTEHLAHKGSAIPADSRSFDRWFQHIAIVVSDMDRAYETLRQHHVKYVSTEPQTLPAWNKNAAGIKAFYFRDPEDHVLEVIYFPPGKGDPRWQTPAGRLFLGIDHTAIVVSDTEKSLAFYRDVLGMRVAGSGENHGPEQEHLNQVFGARLRITALRAGHGPGIEFLEYLTPPGGRALPPSAKASDLVFWNTHLTVTDLPAMNASLHRAGARFVSRADKNARAKIIRDPDGHALELDERAFDTTVTRNSPVR